MSAFATSRTPLPSEPIRMTEPSSSLAALLFLGIDVGGTDVKLGVVDTEGQLVAEDRTPTARLGTPANVFEHAQAFAETVMASPVGDNGQLAAVGLAVPGVLDTRESVIREVVNLQGWLGVRLQDELDRVFQLPSTVTNDANAAAYAEHALRHLQTQSLALVTLGTGVGCGMVVAGEPFGGDHGCAGELGHITIDFSDAALACTCGSRGHLETYAGSGGVVARMQALLEKSDQANSTGRSLDPSDPITPRIIAAGAESGDLLCQQVIAETAAYVGRAIGLIGQIANPAVVLLGGAMTFGGEASEVGRRFLETVRETVKRTTLVQVGENICVDFATLGNQAGVIGAAMVAQHRLEVLNTSRQMSNS
ncbi:ROK family protein [Novipirellula artificiosorum]|uniref:Glucokinase n=1 Tax=Novipirellula artificiosorum TaxID=2528016 RepID=A0A5C6D482_9BACT|nr:ROK family protein [Novipirellula artificiosorum]TWU31568.1 Glucokinase [Novipirellula artificiosorum]